MKGFIKTDVRVQEKAQDFKQKHEVIEKKNITFEQ